MRKEDEQQEQQKNQLVSRWSVIDYNLCNNLDDGVDYKVNLASLRTGYSIKKKKLDTNNDDGFAKSRRLN